VRTSTGERPITGRVTLDGVRSAPERGRSAVMARELALEAAGKCRTKYGNAVEVRIDVPVLKPGTLGASFFSGNLVE
jgi:hypothetical protein